MGNVSYVSERITNLEDLESLIRTMRMDIQIVRQELKKDSPSIEVMKELSKEIEVCAVKAEDFEFYIEQRLVHLTNPSESESMNCSNSQAAIESQ